MRKHTEIIILSIIVGLSLILRLPQLSGSFWLDEAAQVLESVRPLSQQLHIVDDFQPPLIHIWIHFLLFFSHQEWWLRMGAAVIPSLITIWATYQVGKKLFSVGIGRLASILLATSSFAIFYSQELRPYALPGMWAALTWLMTVGWLKQLPVKKISTANVLIFIFLSVAGWYSSYLYPFLFISQIIFIFLFLPHLKKKVFMILGSVTLLFLPWLPMFFKQLMAGQSLRADLPGWEKVVSFDQFKSLALTIGKFIFGVTNLDLNKTFLLTSILLSVIFFPLLLNLMRQFFQRSNKDKPKIILVLMWLFLPILLIWLVSFVVPILQPKRVLLCLPGFDLLLAYLIGQPLQNLLQSHQKPQINFLQLQTYTASILATLLLITLNLISTFQFYSLPQYQREDWRGLHQQITTQYPRNTVAIFAFPQAFAPWRWYDDGKYPVITTGTLTTDHMDSIDNLKKATDFQTVLVFDYLRDLTDSQHKIDAQLKEYGYTEVNQITPGTPLGIIHVYQKKDRTLSYFHL